MKLRIRYSYASIKCYEVAQIDAATIFKRPQSLYAIEIVGNSMRQFEYVRPSLKTGLKIIDHLVPTTFVQLPLEHNQHTFLVGHALKEPANVIWEFGPSGIHFLHLAPNHKTSPIRRLHQFKTANHRMQTIMAPQGRQA